MVEGYKQQKRKTIQLFLLLALLKHFALLLFVQSKATINHNETVNWHWKLFYANFRNEP